MQRLATAGEFRDDNTGQHTRRVGETSSLLARGLGMSEEFCLLLKQAAPLHDIGKIAIPDAILLKPGRLTDPEMAIMRTHAELGAKILSGSQSQLIQLAEVIALTHHEQVSGKGYPEGLIGEAIPVVGHYASVSPVRLEGAGDGTRLLPRACGVVRSSVGLRSPLSWPYPLDRPKSRLGWNCFGGDRSPLRLFLAFAVLEVKILRKSD